MAATTTVQVTVPAMGESVAEGTILEWHKAEGDTVAVDETIVEISTDKVDAEIPSPVAGTVVKIHVAEGDTVAVGTVLCDIDTDGGAAPSNGGEPEAPAAEEAQGGETIEVVMPQMGESVSEGTVLEWAKAAGETIEADETIVEISTDKVDAEVPAPATGTITEILAEAGDTVTVGQVLARMETGPGAAKAASPAPEVSDAPRPGTDAPSSAGNGAAHDASPVARRAAAAENVDLAGVQGSGPKGRITKADVLHVRDNGPATDAGTTAERTQLKGSAAMLARYMDESRSIPTATSFRQMTVTVLDARRKQLKEAGRKVSFTHLIAWAIAKVATDDMPQMAHHFDEEDGKGFRVDDGAVNLGLAVDVEKKDGTRTLMVPVIRDAGRLSFSEFLDAYNALVEKARTNTLTADDLTGGNITLTNPGGIGTVFSVPRLMGGQGTIVATGAIGYPPGLGRVGAQLGAEKIMGLTSTYDHRIIQGAESGQFLKALESRLQGESSLLRGGLPRPRRPAARAAAGARATARRRAVDRRGAGRRRAVRGAAPGRAGRDVRRQGPPHPRPPRRASSTRSAPSPTATRRSTPRPSA